MNCPEHYFEDVLAFFDGKPQELGLYEALFADLEELFPEARVKVQKSQISFYGRHLFAAASLPLRRKKDRPKVCILLTFGLGERKDSPRIAVATEPYPGRWTYHVVLSQQSQLDETIKGFLREAWDFSQAK